MGIFPGKLVNNKRKRQYTKHELFFHLRPQAFRNSLLVFAVFMAPMQAPIASPSWCSVLGARAATNFRRVQNIISTGTSSGEYGGINSNSNP